MARTKLKDVRRLTLLSAAMALSPVVVAQSTGSDGVSSMTRSASGRPIEAQRLGNSDYCGHCHTDIFHQWNASSHHFSSFNNPVYRRVAEYTARQRGSGILKFCAGCHDPLPLLAGEVPSADLNQWAPNAGITCLACHRITAVHGSNAAYEVSAPTLHPFALSDHPAQQSLHRLLLRFTPGLHRSVLTKLFYKSPEYCATCHTVTSPKAVNGATDLPMQDELGQWRSSHYAGSHADDPSRRTCIDCHMPLVPSRDPAAKNGRIRSHRFTGGNTFLPAINLDLDQLRATEQFLRTGVVGLRCKALLRHSGGEVVPCTTVVLAPGDEMELRIAVENTGAGHNFPAGTSDSNEAWLSIELTDADGRTVLRSGALDADGNLGAGAVSFRARYVDELGAPVDRRNATTDAVKKVDDSTITAGKGRTAIYHVQIPTAARLPLRLRANVNWRKHPPAFLRWVFAGKDVPPSPVTNMAELDVRLGMPPR